MTRRVRFILTALIGLWSAAPLTWAAPPQITRIAAPSLMAGSTTTLTIEGTNLTPNPRIVLPLPIASQTLKGPATANRVQLEVKLDRVSPGFYPLRLACDHGISNPVIVALDSLPQQPFGPEVAGLPIALNGTLAGSAVLSTTVAGKKGQRLVIEVEARRLGSAIDPVVKLFDPRRIQLASSQGGNTLAGDARLITVLPADGTYTIQLHDLQYRAGTPNAFRLKMGDLAFADLAFPLAGQRGTTPSFQIIGSLAENARVKADLTTAFAGSFFPLSPLPGLNCPVPRVVVSDILEAIEAEQPAGKLQDIAVSSAINGRLLKPKEEDRYRLAVQPGMKLRFDFLAERAGSPVDGVLILRNEAGVQLVRSDDQPGSLDPALDYTVPAGLNALVVAVSDLHGRGGPAYVYRLAVTPAGRPDFSLALAEDRFQVSRNGSFVTRVRAVRSGFDGPIKLTLPGLPEGLLVSGDEIPAGAAETLLSLTTPEGAKLSQVVLSIVGRSGDPAVPLERLALLPEASLPQPLFWLRSELGFAVTEAAPFGVVWDQVGDALPRGGQLTAKVKVNRSESVKGTVRLSLLTSQVVSKAKNGKDDVNRALRLEGMSTIAADRDTAEIKILVPADLPILPYDFAIRAELLGPDGKKVLMTAVTASRRLVASK